MATTRQLQQMQQWLDSTPEVPPYRMAEYQHSDWKHGHSYYADIDESLESVGEGLAVAITSCNEDRHNGHGAAHTPESANLAYFEAIAQVLNSEDIRAYQELRRNMRNYIKWGGHMPAVVFTPNQRDPDQWDAIVTNPDTGSASIYPTLQTLEMPSPREVGARPNKLGPGFITRKQPKIPS
mgnify:CR=1 FL=1